MDSLNKLIRLNGLRASPALRCQFAEDIAAAHAQTAAREFDAAVGDPSEAAFAKYSNA